MYLKFMSLADERLLLWQSAQACLTSIVLLPFGYKGVCLKMLINYLT